ncbi:MAG TPA: hypothetical protein VH187_07965 [Scandinavium sp.]|jgi:hypothetical protein|uniref:hypothetical protein n=1 Tax=Scandinavium sp. TaxID=2830653 RepID=UPI002E34C9CE|nr:hypothetical protein [Scandinavium sp.]HEX4501080.1 hypothetical protein [Scandinavium sp.]
MKVKIGDIVVVRARVDTIVESDQGRSIHVLVGSGEDFMGEKHIWVKESDLLPLPESSNSIIKKWWASHEI